MHTDTRVERPTEDVLASLEKARNDGSTSYRARHRHKPGPAGDGAATARVSYLPVHERTELIPAVKVTEFKAVVPLPPRPSAPDLTSVQPVPVAMPSEPVAPISDNLLERVLRGLRKLRGAR